VADLVGVGYVGIGLDISFHHPELRDTPLGNFDRSHWWPASLGYGAGLKRIYDTPPETWQALPDALKQNAMNDEEIPLVLGGNMRRIAAQVWR
jgi:microsomal dipeptidase-like Zn-dependent dipeptidase